MGIVASLRVYIRSILTPRRKQKIVIDGRKFTLKQPSMGEYYDLADIGDMGMIIPEAAKITDGLIFFDSDEYLEKVLEEGRAMYPILREASVAAEHATMEQVTGVSKWAQLTLSPSVYFQLKNAVEQFTGIEVNPELAKKNFGTWSLVPGIVQARKKQTTIRSSRKGIKSMKSDTGAQPGKNVEASPSTNSEPSKR